MSKTVDERIVEMQFNNRQFESNISSSIKSLDKLKESLKLDDAAKGFDKIESSAKAVDLSSLESGIESLNNRFSVLGEAVHNVFSRIVNSAISAGERVASALTITPITDGFSEYETKMNAITTILTNTASKGTTLDQVNSALNELNTYADQTIYNFGEMTRNIGTFTAAGVDLETAVGAIKGIANLGAGSGSSPTQVATAMYQISQALAAGQVTLQDWNSINNAGMGGEYLQSALKQTAKEMGIFVDETQTFRESIGTQKGTGWLTSDVLLATLNKFANDENLTKAATQVRTVSMLFDTMAEGLGSGWATSWEYIIGHRDEAAEFLTSVKDGFEAITQPSIDARNATLQFWHDNGGRTALIDGLYNSFQALAKVITPIKQAFDDVFPPMTGERLVKLTERFRDFTAKLLISDKTAENIRKTFRGLFSVISIVIKVIGFLVSAVAKIVGAFAPFGSALLSITGWIGEWVYKLDQAIKASQLFEFALSGITKFANILSNAFAKFIDSVETFIKNLASVDTSGVDEFSNKMESSFKPITKISDFFSMVWKGIQSILKKLSPVLEKIKNAFTTAFNAIGDAVKDAFKNVTGEDVAEIIDKGLASTIKASFAVLVAYIALASKKINKFVSIFEKGSDSIIGGVNGILDGVKDSLESYRRNNDAETLLKLAGAIAILAAAIYALSSIDTDKLLTTTGAVVGLIVGVASAIKILTSSFNTDMFNGVALKNFKDVTGWLNMLKSTLSAMISASAIKQAGKAMVYMAAAVLILAIAIKKLGGMEWEEIGKGLTAVGILMGILVGSCVTMSKFGKLGKDSAKAILIMAVAIDLLMIAIKSLAGMNFLSMAQGLIGLGVVLAEISWFMKNTATEDKGISPKAAASILILSVALNVIALAVRQLGSINVAGLAAGVVALGVILGEISAFVESIQKSENKGIIKTALGITILGVAINLFATAVIRLGSLAWYDVIQGMVAFETIMTNLTICLNKLDANGIVKKAAGVLVLGIALNVFAAAVAILGSMRIDEMIRGLTSFVVVISGIVYALNTINEKEVVKKAAAVLILGVGIERFASAIKKLGSMNLATLAQGFIAFVGVLVIAVKALNSIKSSNVASLAGFAAGIYILALALKALSAIKFTDMLSGLVGLAGVVAIFSVALAFLSGLSAPLSALAKPLALIGLSTLALGAGVLMLAAALALLAVSGSAVTTMLLSLIAGLATMIPYILTQIAAGIVAFVTVIGSAAPLLVNAIKNIIVSCIKAIPEIVEELLSAIDSILKAIEQYGPSIANTLLTIVIDSIDFLGDRMPEIVAAVVKLVRNFFDALGGYNSLNVLETVIAMDYVTVLFGQLVVAGISAKTALKGALAMVAVVGMIAALFFLLNLLPIETTMAIATSLSEVLLSITACLYVVSKIPVSAAITGLESLGIAIAALTGILAALGGLNQIPGFSWLIGEGAQVLSTIGNAIGSFVGNIISGFATGLTSGLPQLATNLSDFMTNLEPFIDGTSKLNPEMLSGVESLIGVIVGLTAANVMDALTSWLTGGTSFVKFGKQLSEFAPYLVEYANKVKGLDQTSISGSAMAINLLSSVAQALPKTNGFIGVLFGGNSSLVGFAAQLPKLADYLKEYANKLNGFDAGSVTASAFAAKALANFASELPDTGGLLSRVFGNNSIEDFGEKLPALAEGLSSYSNTLSGFREEDSARIKSSIEALTALAELGDIIPNSGGWLGAIVGNNDLDDFGLQLPMLATGLLAYSTALQAYTPEDTVRIESSIEALTALAELGDIIPNSGGWIGAIVGNNDLDDFGLQLPALGAGLVLYLNSLENYDDESTKKIKSSVKALKSLAELGDVIPNSGGFIGLIAGNNDLDDFGAKLPALGEGLASYSSSVSEISNSSGVTTSVDVLEKLSEVGNAIKNTGGFVSLFTGDNGIDKFGKKLPALGVGLKSFSDSVTDFNSTDAAAATAAAGALNALSQTLPKTGGFLNIFTGNYDLANFGNQLPYLGEGLKGFSDALEGYDSSNNAAAISAAGALSAVANNLPNTGGFLGLFEGDPDVEGFAESLPTLGKCIKEFSYNVDGISSDTTAAANAAIMLSKVAQNLPNEGGFISIFTGHTEDMEDFASGLPGLGKAVKGFADEVGDGIDATSVNAAANVASVIGALKDNLPTEGGIFSVFTGHTVDLEDFAEGIKALGPAIVDFADTTDGVTTESVQYAANVASIIGDLANVLPNTGGLWGLIAGNKTSIEDFGAMLPDFGSNLADFATNVKGITEEDTAGAIKAIEALETLSGFIETLVGITDVASGLDYMTEFSNELPNLSGALTGFCTDIAEVNTVRLAYLVTYISDLIDMANDFDSSSATGFTDFLKTVSDAGKNGLGQFVNAVTANIEQVKLAATSMLDAFIAGVESKTESVKLAMTKIANAANEALKLKWSAFNDTGVLLASGFSNGFATVKGSLETKARGLADAAINALKEKQSSFYSAGTYLASGFAEGISANSFMAAARAREMASSAADAAAKELDEHSPSKVGYRIGDYFGVAFVNALSDYADKSYTAGAEMAGSAKRGLSNAIAQVADLVENGVDTRPTIRPVLDLSEIQNGKNQLFGMINQWNGFGLSGSMNMARGIANGMSIRAAAANVNMTAEAIKSLQNSIDGSGSNRDINNTFYINGDNPKEIANEVSRILQLQVERKNASWA